HVLRGAVTAKQRCGGLGWFLRIERGIHTPAAGLSNNTGEFGEGIRSAVVHARAGAADGVGCDDAALRVDAGIDEVVVIASVAAISDTAKRALNRRVRRSVSDKPCLAAVVSSRD